MRTPIPLRCGAALLAALGLGLVVGGCGPAIAPSETPQAPPAKPTAREVSVKETTVTSESCCCDPADEPASPPTAQATPPVALRVVKLDRWEADVRAQRGKVVVADAWASYCVPCKREFPHLVELHRRYAKDGLVCTSVSVDSVKDKDKALAFLKAQNATFANYLLDEDYHVWQDRWKLEGVPAVFVFGRDGKLVRRFDTDDPHAPFTYADVEKLVQQLLR